MRLISFILLLLINNLLFASGAKHHESPALFTPDNPKIQYTGRIDFSDPMKPRFWSSGVYIITRFKGTSCEVMLNDEELYGQNHNWVNFVVDGKPVRMKMTGKTNVIKVAENLPAGIHTLLICKDTESGNGYLELTGIRCEALLTPPAKPKHKIEYIGDSITCGSGMDFTIPCDKGQWYDQHNAYESYGAVTARALNAQYHITSVSGIGLIHSCCGMTIGMPEVFDKMNQRLDTIQWDFSRYQPDVVTICLGQNDGIQDSTTYCGAYVKFIKDLRNHYPKADIICLSSPMADATLNAALQKYILAVSQYLNQAGDKKVSHYFFGKRYSNGCGTHPDMDEHKQIAAELTSYLQKLKGW